MGFTRWIHGEAPPERREVRRLANADGGGFDPIGAARALSVPLSASVVWGWWLIGVGLGALFCFGIAHRVVGPALALVFFGWATYRSSWGQLLHFEHLLSIHLLILAFAPAADVWAVRGRSGTDRGPNVRYGWPIRLLAIATVVAYFLSGIAKLRLAGLDWLQTETLANHIAYSAIRIEQLGGPTPPMADWVLGRRWMIAPIAAGTLVVELGAPLALISRRWRRLWIVAALVFHLATAATMLVFFGYRGLGIGLTPLLAIERPLIRWRQRRGREAVSSTPIT